MVYLPLMVTTQRPPTLRESRSAQPPAPPLRPGLMLPEAALQGVQTLGVGVSATPEIEAPIRLLPSRVT